MFVDLPYLNIKLNYGHNLESRLEIAVLCVTSDDHHIFANDCKLMSALGSTNYDTGTYTVMSISNCLKIKWL